MAKRFSQETKEKARTMRASGMTYVDIAKGLGCTAPCARYWCDEQARVENGGRAKADWVRVSHKEGYRSHMDGLRRTGTSSNDIPEVEVSAIQGIYSLCTQLTKESGYPHEVDHIVPVSQGGEHRIWNLRIVPRFMNRTGRGT